MNCAFFVGNVVDKPELKEIGDSWVLNFSVAVDTQVYDKEEDDYVNRPDYLDCAMFGKRAKAISKYLKKGMKVSCQARIHQDRWKSGDGNRSKIVFHISDLELPPKND